MKLISSLLLLVFTSLAVAAPLIYEDSNLRITLSETEPCTNEKVLALIPAEYRARFFAAEEVYQGRKIAACWAVTPRGIAVADEEGDAGELPMEGISRGKEV